MIHQWRSVVLPLVCCPFPNFLSFPYRSTPLPPPKHLPLQTDLEQPSPKSSISSTTLFTSISLPYLFPIYGSILSRCVREPWDLSRQIDLVFQEHLKVTLKWDYYFTKYPFQNWYVVSNRSSEVHVDTVYSKSPCDLHSPLATPDNHDTWPYSQSTRRSSPRRHCAQTVRSVSKVLLSFKNLFQLCYVTKSHWVDTLCV